MLLDIAANPAAGGGQFPDWLVVVMGLCTVFVCLVALIAIIFIMSAIVRALTGKKSAAPVPTATAPVAAPVAVASAPIATTNKQEMVAAIGVAVAENMGTDISRIRIHSIKAVGGVAPSSTKQQLVAAIGVAIATNMGTDVSRIRIHSIRKIEA